VLLYDLTSTYFEVNASGIAERQQAPPRLQPRQAAGLPAGGDRAGGDARRLAAAYEVLPGTPADSKTLRMFLADRAAIRQGAAVWVMDRGVPTEAVLAEMRTAIAGCSMVERRRAAEPIGRAPATEALAGRAGGREGQAVGGEDGELYVFAQSHDRVTKERAMRRRQLKWLWSGSGKSLRWKIRAKSCLMNSGGARSRAAARLASGRCRDRQGAPELHLSPQSQEAAKGARREAAICCRTISHRQRSTQLWQYYTRSSPSKKPSAISRETLGNPADLPSGRAAIEAHIFIAFLGLLHADHADPPPACLGARVDRAQCVGKIRAVQMIDVHLPTPTGREIRLTRYTPSRARAAAFDRPAEAPPATAAAAQDHHRRRYRANARSEDLLV